MERIEALITEMGLAYFLMNTVRVLKDSEDRIRLELHDFDAEMRIKTVRVSLEKVAEKAMRQEK